MIKLIKECEGSWCIWNTKNNKCADIVKINEHNAYVKSKSRYRVDFKGSTISSMIDNFQTARGIATKAVKEG
jgi:hypothetical protein